MTGRFDRYLLQQLLTLFGFFALVLVLVYWINRAVILFDRLIANGQSATVFFEFSALSLPNVIRVVLPIAAFAGTVYTINRLTSESELVVVQATGFSPWRLMRPVLVFGVIVFLLGSILAHLLVPLSLSRLAERTAEVSENLTARLLTEGEFLHPTDDVTFYISEISPRGELLDIFMSDARGENERTTYTAREALLIRGEEAPVLLMLNGMAQSLDTENRLLSVTRFENLTLDLGGLVEGLSRRPPRANELFTHELLRASEATQALTGSTRARLVAEGHERFSNALNGLVAPLIGFATLLVGGFSRFGIWRQIVTAIFLLIVVQMVTQAGQDAVQGNAALWPFAYAGPALGLAMAFFMLFVAAHPALFSRYKRVPDDGGAA